MLAALGLCFGLAGCVDLENSVVNAALPHSMMATAGTVTAVNATDRTLEIKTDFGNVLVLLVTDTTKLGVKSFNPLALQDEEINFTDVKVGKYLEVQCAKDAADGKHVLSFAEMHDSKASAESREFFW